MILAPICRVCSSTSVRLHCWLRYSWRLTGRAAVPALFDATAHVPYLALSVLALSALVLNTGVGLLVGRRVSGHTPLSLLREE